MPYFPYPVSDRCIHCPCCQHTSLFHLINPLPCYINSPWRAASINQSGVSTLCPATGPHPHLDATTPAGAPRGGVWWPSDIILLDIMSPQCYNIYCNVDHQIKNGSGGIQHPSSMTVQWPAGSMSPKQAPKPLRGTYPPVCCDKPQ